ncbi:MAG: pyridoxamine 5'-phosphate oxidase family protein [Chitinophagales bacterium]|nr:pyridoxamine 5'-phosphate oxidase family protein [Chitinophagales bacterium]
MNEINDNIENLASTEAINKIKELATDADICLFVTHLEELPLSGRPMSTQEVDDEGNLWFFSDRTSDKNMHILNDNRVQLFYGNRNDSEYLCIYGTAEILTDRNKIKELWKPLVKAWFNEGEDDPDITLLKVKPVDAYYWDTKDNKMISLIKIAISAMTGKTMDGSVEGSLKV